LKICELPIAAKVQECELQSIKVAVTSGSILVALLLLMVLVALLTPVWAMLYRRRVSQAPTWLKRIVSIARAMNGLVFVASFILLLAMVIYLLATSK
jgi:hypothetical protein